MTEYLYQIAARNMLNDSPSLMPVMPLTATEEPDPFEQERYAEPGPVLLPQSNPLPAEQPQIYPQPVTESLPLTFDKENTDDHAGITPPVVQYITSYVERFIFTKSGEPQYMPGQGDDRNAKEREYPVPVTSNEKQYGYVSVEDEDQEYAGLVPEESGKKAQQIVFTNEYKESPDRIPVKTVMATFLYPQHDTDLTKSRNTGNSGAAQNASVEKGNSKAVRRQDIDPADIPSYESKPMRAESMQEIRPAVKQQNVQAAASSSTPERLQPVRLHHVQVRPANNTPAPKLVIGKITVEVVQPDKPGPVKIVHQVKQVAPVTTGSKTNKPSFGLGQL